MQRRALTVAPILAACFSRIVSVNTSHRVRSRRFSLLASNPVRACSDEVSSDPLPRVWPYCSISWF